MRLPLHAVMACIFTATPIIAEAAEANPFEARVLDDRPRIFLRDDAFAGLTVEKLRSQLREGDLTGARNKWRARPVGRGILWLLDGRREDLDAAIAGLNRMDASGGSWSDRGPALVRLATLFDWLYEDLDEVTRRQTIHKIERAADDAVRHVRDGRAPFFYSRTPGALAGLCVAGLALHGVSHRADAYLQTFRDFGVDEFFPAYQWVDGAATGATYTLNYTYVDLPSICAAWWSATNQNPADWIRTEQGDWLDGIVSFYLWYMRPGFAFTDINDQFRGNWETHDEFCQGLDIASYVTRNGYGRTWSERWLARFGTALYHPVYAHNLIFRYSDLAPRPLIDLPRAELFGRDSCGYGFFRSDWPKAGQPDEATHVFFRCGDPMNVHGGVAAGEFQVFKYTPLAARSGRYSSYDSPPDQYHRNCISTNVVLFTDPADPDDRGDQRTRRGLKSDHATWDDWLRIRERNGMDVARIVDWNVRPGLSRCRADLSRTNPEDKCRQWIREFVWLADRHLIVLDIVETSRPEIRRRWQLHLPAHPQVGDRLLTVVDRAPEKRWADAALRPLAREGRLVCQTLLPRQYRVVRHGDGQAEAYTAGGQPLGAVDGNAYHRKYGRHVVQVDPGNDSTKTVFLHVLTATRGEQTEPPEATCAATGTGEIDVTVDGVTVRLDVAG